MHRILPVILDRAKRVSRRRQKQNASGPLGRVFFLIILIPPAFSALSVFALLALLPETAGHALTGAFLAAVLTACGQMFTATTRPSNKN